MDLRRENDVEQLRRVALVQQAQIELLLKALAQKCAELEKLKGGEQELQQTLELIESIKARAVAPPAGQDASTTKPRKPRTDFGPTEQPRLEIEEQVFELDEADRTCPSCGLRLKPWTDEYESSEMVDVVEVHYRVLQVKQQKYVCNCGGCVETAPGPERATPGGRYSLAFAVKVVIDKYLDHLPLERQVRIMDRHGLELSSQTLWDQLNALAAQLRATYDALFARLLREPVIGLDQTSWKRLDTRGGRPWQMWCLTAPRLIYHRICDDKSANTFRALVGDYSGTIVCDALATHAAGARDGPGIVLAGCWAHAYRKFDEARTDHLEAALATAWIGELYEIEERTGDDDALRAELRRTESTKVLESLKAWLWNQAALKSLSIGRAAAYTLANWDRLVRFVDDARIPLDNNATERAIRGPVIGRRNHFGSKSVRGTEVAAIFYSLIETAKLCGVDPARYLLEAVRAARMNAVLMPWELAS